MKYIVIGLVCLVVIVMIYLSINTGNDYKISTVTNESFNTNKSFDTEGFRKEIVKWTSKANTEPNVIKSTLYRSYAMSNLYFLQPFIPDKEYRLLSFYIGEIPDTQVPRYIDPKMVLNVID